MTAGDILYERVRYNIGWGDGYPLLPKVHYISLETNIAGFPAGRYLFSNYVIVDKDPSDPVSVFDTAIIAIIALGSNG